MRHMSKQLALSMRAPHRGSNPFPVAPPRGISPGVAEGETSPRARSRSPLTDLFPTFATIHAGFTSIALDGTFTASAGHVGVYGLQSVTAGVDIPQEFAVFSVNATLQSPDTAGTLNGGINACAWGTDGTSAQLNGRKAAIIMGINLPITLGNWVDWHPRVVGLDITSAAGKSSVNDRAPLPFWWAHFPPGSCSTNANNRVAQPSRSWAPWVMRVPLGARLDIGFALAGEANASWLEDFSIYGFADVQVGIGLTSNRVRWEE